MGASRFLIPGIFGLLTVVTAVTASTAASNIPGKIQPYLSWSWPVLGVLTVLFVAFTVVQAFRASPHIRHRRVRRVTEEVTEEGVLKEPARDEPAPPIPKPPEPYFAHRYPMQENFTGRVREREMLTQWLVGDQRPVFTLTAIGGMGKSALAWAWLQRDVLGLPLPGLSNEPADGVPTTRVPEANRPDGALWWSFYTPESRFSAFLDRALAYVSSGDIDPSSISSGYEKAQTLLNLLQQHSILLVLDGFERELRAYASLMAAYQDENVAETEGAEARSCSDPAATAFLRGIAGGALKGRVLLTSRLFPQELENLAGQRREDLASMDPDDAVVFFQAQGVRGTRVEIQAACEPYGYHPLALRLLAGVIVEDNVTPGDVRVAERNPIPLELLGQDRQHHILQVSYDALGRPGRELLSKLAAFRSTMDYQTIEAVFGRRGGEGSGPVATARRMVAAALLGGRRRDLGTSLRELTNRGLLFREGNRYDIHPVVRQYAYARLTDKEGVHAILRDYFAEIPAPDPDNVRSVGDLAPVIELYHHTVGAGHYDEASDLFSNQLRGPLYYRLGAYNTVIELLRSLFPDGENYPPKLKNQGAQSWTLNELGNAYSSTGQPRRAVPLKGRSNHIDQMIGSSKRNIVSGLINLADNQLNLGELEAAEKNLRRSIQESREIETTSQSDFHEAVGHNELGRLFVYRGDFGEAAQELETGLVGISKQGNRQGECVVWAYRAIRSLLLGQGAAALEAAAQSRQLADVRGNARDIIQAEWPLGAALVSLAPGAMDEQNKTLADAESHLAEALTRSRRINLVELEPDILLAWACWHRAKSDARQAREVAQEALTIADRSEYRLKQADIHNFLARLSKDAGTTEAARAHAQVARDYAECDGPPHPARAGRHEADQLLKDLEV